MAKATDFYIYRHKKAVACKIVKRIHRHEVAANPSTYMIRGFVLRICECGLSQAGERVFGKLSTVKQCDARCMGSTSGKCECSCEGVNHGGSHAA